MTTFDYVLRSSVQLHKRDGGWWLTLSYDEEVIIQTSPDAPVVGIDVGIANFVTTSTGKHYGSFHQKLRTRHKRDRAKRRRKAKMRACLEKKGVEQLPSTSSRTGQKLMRHTRQEINRAVKQCFADPAHAEVQFAYERISNCAPVVTEKPSKPCLCSVMRHGKSNRAGEMPVR